MHFQVTAGFLDRYEALDDATARCVDDAIRRLLDDHRSAWARQNRVVGVRGWAWLIAIRCGGQDLALYWREATDKMLELLLLRSN